MRVTRSLRVSSLHQIVEVGYNIKVLSKLKMSHIDRPLTNDAIEEDADEPKEVSHLDYKYLKSYEGPMTKP